MKPDQSTIDSDIRISTHRIVASILRDPDEAYRTIATESRTLFLMGCAHVDKEMGKVATRRLPEPSTVRMVPLMAARAAMAMDHPAAQEDASHAARTALAGYVAREALQLGRAIRAKEHGAKEARFNDKTVVIDSNGYYEGLSKGLCVYR